MPPHRGERACRVRSDFVNIAVFTDSYKPYVSGVVN